jgi:hypothetical protein
MLLAIAALFAATFALTGWLDRTAVVEIELAEIDFAAGFDQARRNYPTANSSVKAGR